jgi:hypothetical protein
MTVTNQDKEYLHALLWANVRNQETYEELYDHILTALECASETDGPASRYLDIIIARDFGTIAILKDLEIERVKVLTTHIRKRLWKRVLAYFKFPLMLFTLCATGLIFVMIGNVSRTSIFWLITMIALMPFVSHSVHLVKHLWHRETQKVSVKDGAIATISCGISFLNFTIFQIFHNDHYWLFNRTHPLVISVIFMCYSIYTLSFIKVYAEEFKMNIA